MKFLLASLLAKDSFGEFADTIERAKQHLANARYVRDIKTEAIKTFNTINLVRRHIPCKPSKKP